MAYLASLPMLNDDATHMAAVEELKRQQEEMAAQREAATREALGVRAQQAADAQIAARTQGLSTNAANRLRSLTGADPDAAALEKIKTFAGQGSVYVGEDADTYGSREDYIVSAKRKAKKTQEQAKAEAESKYQTESAAIAMKKKEQFANSIREMYGKDGAADAEKIITQADESMQIDAATKEMNRLADAADMSKDRAKRAELYAKSTGIAKAIDGMKAGQKEKSYARAYADIKGIDADAAMSMVEENLANTAPENRDYDTTEAEARALQSGMARYSEIDDGKLKDNPILPMIQNLEKRGLQTAKLDASQESNRLRVSASLANAAQSRYASAQALLNQLESEKAKLDNALRIAQTKARSASEVAGINERRDIIVQLMKGATATMNSAMNVIGKSANTTALAMAAAPTMADSLLANQAALSGAVGFGALSKNSAKVNQQGPMSVGLDVQGLLAPGGYVPMVKTKEGLLGKSSVSSGEAAPSENVELTEEQKMAARQANANAKARKKEKKPPKVPKVDPAEIAALESGVKAGKLVKKVSADGKSTTYSDKSGRYPTTVTN